MAAHLKRSIALIALCAVLVSLLAAPASAIEWQPDAEFQEPQGELIGSGPRPSDTQPAWSNPAAAPASPAAPVVAVAPVVRGSSGTPILNIVLWVVIIAGMGFAYRRFAWTLPKAK